MHRTWIKHSLYIIWSAMLESLHKHNYKTVENSAGCFILSWSQVNQKAFVKYFSSPFLFHFLFNVCVDYLHNASSRITSSWERRRLSFWSIRFSWRWPSQNHMNTFLISSLDIKFGLVWTDSHNKGLVANPFHVGQKNSAWETESHQKVGVVLFQVHWEREGEGKGPKEVTSEGWGRFSRDWEEGCRKGSRRGHSSTAQEDYYNFKLYWLDCNVLHICEHLI